MAENLNKLTTLEQLKSGLVAAKQYTDAQDALLGGRIDELVTEVEGIVATGGQANVLEGVKVNGTALAIAEKMVDILIGAGSANGTIAVNGVDVAITGLQALAFKAQVSEADLDAALTAVIAAKATNADLEALGARVKKLEDNEAGYQTESEVNTLIQAAISASGHAHFEKVDAVPSAETAQDNILYLVMNAETNHYDIYAKVSGEVVLIDDTTVDLSNYYTKEEIDAIVQQAADDVDQDITTLNQAIQAVDAKIGEIPDVTTATNIVEYVDGGIITVIEDTTNKVDELWTAIDELSAVTSNIATEDEVNEMVNEIFNPIVN